MKSILKAFFYSSKDGKFKVPYFYSFITMGFLFGYLTQGLVTGKPNVPVISLLIGQYTFVMGLFNMGKKKNEK